MTATILQFAPKKESPKKTLERILEIRQEKKKNGYLPLKVQKEFLFLFEKLKTFSEEEVMEHTELVNKIYNIEDN